MFLDNDPKGQGEACVRLDILRSAIGDARHVQTLTRHDVQQYEARAGRAAFGRAMDG